MHFTEFQLISLYLRVLESTVPVLGVHKTREGAGRNVRSGKGYHTDTYSAVKCSALQYSALDCRKWK